MKKSIVRILSVVCILVCIFTLSACTVRVKNGDVTVNPDSTEKINYVTKTYDIPDDFEKISIDVDLDTVTLTPSEDGRCSIICYDDEQNPHTVDCSSNTLTIKKGSETSETVSDGTTPTLTVYLPAKTYKEIELEVSVGDVTVEKADCEELKSSIDVGNITLNNVIATDKFNIDVATGSITFNNCDALKIKASTDLGDITGTLLSAKTFTASAELGSVEVPQNGNGGDCELVSKIGNIKIEITK